MADNEEVFEKALLGKKLPILPLDNKWYRLMAGFEITKEMQAQENQIKELLKEQGRCNTEIKRLKKEKNILMEGIVNAIDSDDATSVQEENRNKIEAYNTKIDEYQDRLLDIPASINELNYQLMLATMSQCYEKIADNTAQIEEIAAWIAGIRVELKKNVVRKQEKELKNQEIYNYMHDIFGAEVIDIFDMKYNPGEKILKSGGKSE